MEDTINLHGTDVTSSRIIGGGGNDTFTFQSNVSGASIVGGDGNDSFTIDSESATAATNYGTFGDSNTFFFGSGHGLDTIAFSNASTNGAKAVDMTFAVDSSYGATSGYTFSTSTSLVTSGAASIFVTGITGSKAAVNGDASVLGFNFTTVSTGDYCTWLIFFQKKSYSGGPKGPFFCL